MEITWTKSLGEYDIYNPGPERSFTYTVRNTSAPFATNTMLGLILPTGLDAGLFYLDLGNAMPDWDFYYGSGETSLVNTNHTMTPGITTTIEIRSDSLCTRLAYATAFTASSIQFNPALVEVAARAAPPAALADLTVGANAVTLTATNLLWGYSCTLQESATLYAWTNTVTFWATNGLTQIVTVPQPINAPARFYRLRSP
jgi:hypothetical protein